jgi:ribosome assembly protein YihI (activator of Der GTPase)
MPSKSPEQARLMAAAAHDPQLAKKVGVPVTVAQEYNQADKGKKLAEAMKRMRNRKES